MFFSQESHLSQNALMVTTLAHFTTTALVPDAHVCHANQPEQFSLIIKDDPDYVRSIFTFCITSAKSNTEKKAHYN